jgi:hypothetical protein
MAARSSKAPRFLPTLTEVVHARVELQRGPGHEFAPQDDADQVAIVERVRWQLEGEMDGLLRDAVAAALLEQVDAVAARLRQEIEPILLQAVADMVAHEIASRRHN